MSSLVLFSHGKLVREGRTRLAQEIGRAAAARGHATAWLSGDAEPDRIAGFETARDAVVAADFLLEVPEVGRRGGRLPDGFLE